MQIRRDTPNCFSSLDRLSPPCFASHAQPSSIRVSPFLRVTQATAPRGRAEPIRAAASGVVLIVSATSRRFCFCSVVQARGIPPAPLRVQLDVQIGCVSAAQGRGRWYARENSQLRQCTAAVRIRSVRGRRVCHSLQRPCGLRHVNILCSTRPATAVLLTSLGNGRPVHVSAWC